MCVVGCPVGNQSIYSWLPDSLHEQYRLLCHFIACGGGNTVEYSNYKNCSQLGLEVLTGPPRTKEAEAGGSLNSRPIWATKKVPNQLGLQNI